MFGYNFAEANLCDIKLKAFLIHSDSQLYKAEVS